MITPISAPRTDRAHETSRTDFPVGSPEIHVTELVLAASQHLIANARDRADAPARFAPCSSSARLGALSLALRTCDTCCGRPGTRSDPVRRRRSLCLLLGRALRAPRQEQNTRSCRTAQKRRAESSHVVDLAHDGRVRSPSSVYCSPSDPRRHTVEPASKLAGSLGGEQLSQQSRRFFHPLLPFEKLFRPQLFKRYPGNADPYVFFRVIY